MTMSAQEQGYADLAFDGQNYLVVWEDFRDQSNFDGDIYAARMAPDGTVLDGSGILISNAPGRQRRPRVGWDGDNYLVAWLDGAPGSEQIIGTRVTPGGQVLDPAGIPIAASPVGSFSVAASGENYLVVWGAGEVRGTRVSPEGVVLDPGRLSHLGRARHRSLAGHRRVER